MINDSDHFIVLDTRLGIVEKKMDEVWALSRNLAVLATERQNDSQDMLEIRNELKGMKRTLWMFVVTLITATTTILTGLLPLLIK